VIKSITHLRKTEYDTFYSSHYKYPLLVHEVITASSGKPAPGVERVDRTKIVDPYRKDSAIPEKDQFSFAEYKSLMKYGLSPGHNTPAGNHGTTREIWDESFLMTNMTPQEMTFNSGMWVLVEAWSRNLGSNPKIKNVHCFTGCVPDDEFVQTAEGVLVNIPTHWFKILTAQDAHNPKTVYTLAFYMKNDKMFVKRMETYQLGGFTIPVPKMDSMANLNFNAIMEHYGIYTPGKNHLASLKQIMPIEFRPSKGLQIQMEKCNWFGRFIYAKSLDELEKNWIDIQKMSEKFGDLQYHKEYYDYTKERMLEELGKR
jgi:DNA/RNA endonuclease G (NUC1)